MFAIPPILRHEDQMTQTSALLQALRHATTDRHESLHQHALLRPLQGGDITLGHYHRVLQAFHLAYRVMERARVRNVGFAGELPVRTLLEHDINTHGIEVLPQVDLPYPAINDLSRLVGFLYVKEGSNLGGQVISKHLRRTLALEPGRDNLFFAGHGAQTGMRWRAFLAFLHQKEPSVDAEVVVAQAQASFEVVRLCCDMVAERAPR
ncbi:biliverdin-producing heme oxygenase [Kordiimonas aestuarii]|uniref:biliverdin-producing heme oxygenase n=1 Tax=Kordiimonas aestuarii TaxID=1005925 RepID=UPI0021D3B9E8|nr:biliverdin-producing heme oxygenase [Kordiimonas aestuarii]